MAMAAQINNVITVLVWAEQYMFMANRGQCKRMGIYMYLIFVPFCGTAASLPPKTHIEKSPSDAEKRQTFTNENFIWEYQQVLMQYSSQCRMIIIIQSYLLR